MSTEYSDNPTPTRRRIGTILPASTPNCRCGQRPQMFKEGATYLVKCSDPYCPMEEMPLAENEGCPTKGAALHYWEWLTTGRL